MQKAIPRPEDLRVLILAPTGQDAPLIQRVLAYAGISSLICHGLPELIDMVRNGAGAVLLTQEALQSKDVEVFIGALQAQPSWSDLPITLLTLCGTGQRAIPKLSEQFQKVGNLTVVERPLHALTLTSIVRVALRSRVHQYEMRDLVERLTASQTQLQEKNNDLEQFHDVVVGRELKMMELEKQVEELKRSNLAASKTLQDR
jgi:FixJ family two-component response regulator